MHAVRVCATQVAACLPTDFLELMFLFRLCFFASLQERRETKVGRRFPPNGNHVGCISVTIDRTDAMFILRSDFKPLLCRKLIALTMHLEEATGI